MIAVQSFQNYLGLFLEAQDYFGVSPSFLHKGKHAVSDVYNVKHTLNRINISK